MAIRYKKITFKSTNVRIEFDLKKHAVYLLFSLIWFVSRPLAKYIVKKVFFTPLGYKLSDNEKVMIKNARSFTFKSGDKTLQGYQWGKGPAVVFIHGWAGHGIQFHRYFDGLIKAGFSVLTFDHVGHGKSDGNESSYFEFTDAVTRFIDQQRNLPIQAIVAHSFGASAVINCLFKTQMNIKTILIAPALSLRNLLEETFDRYGVPLAIFKAYLKDLEKKLGHEFATENPKDLIKCISSDMLIVHDTNDKAISYEESWKASLLQNNIRLYSTRGLGHIRILKDKQLIKEMVKKIISYSKPSSVRGFTAPGQNPTNSSLIAATR